MLSRLTATVLTALFFIASIHPAAAHAAPRTDVLVIGGTPAGVAAAVAAARRGENVTLVAARPQLGGVLTDAVMDQWDLNLAPDGTPIEAGIFAEVHAALGDAFSPADAARVFGNLAASEPRIRTILGARPVSVHTSDGVDGTRIDDVTFARSGQPGFIIGAGTVIDATDAAVVATQAGAHYDIGRQDTGIDHLMQPVTLMFTIEGVDWSKVLRGYDTRVDGPGGAFGSRAWGYGKLMDAYWPASPEVLVRDLNFGYEADGSVSVNAIDVLGVDGRSETDLSQARTLTEIEAPHVLAFLRTHLAGFAGARIGHYADAVYVRETVHVLGLAWLTAADVWNGVMPADRIGLSSYPLDLHPVTVDTRLAYAPVRHVYGVPFGAMVPRGFTNMVLASPSISASHEAAGSARVIPTTIEEGEAAGAATAIALQRHVSIAALATASAGVAALQSDLRAHGTILDYRPGLASGAVSGR